MTSDEADDLLRAIHGSWPTLGIMRGNSPTEPTFSIWKKRLLVYSFQSVQRVVAGFFDGDIEIPGKREKPQWKDIQNVLKWRTRDNGDGARMWKNGDVLEHQGHIGIIERDDSIDYAEWCIPHEDKERVCWKNGNARAGLALRVSDEEAERFVRKWHARMKDCCLGYPINALEPEFRKLVRTKTKADEPRKQADAERLADIRAGKKRRGGEPQAIENLF